MAYFYQKVTDVIMNTLKSKLAIILGDLLPDKEPISFTPKTISPLNINKPISPSSPSTSATVNNVPSKVNFDAFLSPKQTPSYVKEVSNKWSNPPQIKTLIPSIANQHDNSWFNLNKNNITLGTVGSHTNSNVNRAVLGHELGHAQRSKTNPNFVQDLVQEKDLFPSINEEVSASALAAMKDPETFKDPAANAILQKGLMSYLLSPIAVRHRANQNQILTEALPYNINRKDLKSEIMKNVNLSLARNNTAPVDSIGEDSIFNTNNNPNIMKLQEMAKGMISKKINELSGNITKPKPMTPISEVYKNTPISSVSAPDPNPVINEWPLLER